MARLPAQPKPSIARKKFSSFQRLFCCLGKLLAGIQKALTRKQECSVGGFLVLPILHRTQPGQRLQKKVLWACGVPVVRELQEWALRSAHGTR